jgi:hypothetical protein
LRPTAGRIRYAGRAAGARVYRSLTRFPQNLPVMTNDDGDTSRFFRWLLIGLSISLPLLMGVLLIVKIIAE